MRNQLLGGVGWVAITRILLSVFGLLSTILLARLLTPADFGIVAIATAMLALLQSLTQLSLASALIQRHETSEEDVHTVWTLSVIRAIVLATFLAIAAPLIAMVYHDGRLLPIMLLTALTGGVGALTNPMIALQAKSLNFKTQFLVQLVQKGSVLFVSVALAYILKSFWSLVLGTLVSVILTTIWSYLVVPYRPRFRLAGAKSLLSFSIWLSLSQFAVMLSWRFDQLLIGYFLNKEDVGAYVVADNLASIPTREATQPLTQVLFPGFAKLVHDPTRLKAAFLLAQATLVAVSFPIGIGFATVARPVIALALGEKWLQIVPMVEIFSVMFAVGMLAAPLQSLAMATGRNKLLFYRDMQGILVRIPLVLLGLWIDGVFGIAFARAISGVAGTFLVLRIVSSIIDITVYTQIRNNYRTFIATAVMACANIVLTGSFVADMPLILEISLKLSIGGVAYLGTRWILWLAAGKPAGPEAEAMRLVSLFRKRERPKA